MPFISFSKNPGNAVSIKLREPETGDAFFRILIFVIE